MAKDVSKPQDEGDATPWIEAGIGTVWGDGGRKFSRRIERSGFTCSGLGGQRQGRHFRLSRISPLCERTSMASRTRSQNLISQVSSEAAKSAREVTSSVADQVGSVATIYADKGAEMTSAASEQAKTVATELEGMARRNPLGTIAGAVLIGVFIGLLGRRN
jgi:ElaB/YqjD/DUF883 family membrane-anchored ribosome-binding protein